MHILSLEIQDILSIKNISISFEDQGLILVEGWNYDTQRANGAGKTAIFNCLSFALYDKLPRKITASEILRRGCKSGFAAVSVICGEDTWTVKRSRPKGVEFFKNGIQQSISQSEFESFIRLTYNQFLLTIYTPQANNRDLSRFLNSPDSHKKEFLLQLLGLDEFSSAKKVADEQVKATQAAIDVDDRKLQSNRSKISAYEESLVDSDVLTQLMLDLQSSIDTITDNTLELAAVVKPDLSKYTKIEDGIRIKMSAIAQAKAKKSMLHDKYRELDASIHSYDADLSCSECGASLHTPEARSAHEENQDKIKQRMVEVKSQIDDCDNAIHEEGSINDLAGKLRDKRQKDSNDYQSAQKHLSDLQHLIKNKSMQIDNAKSKLDNNSELLIKINNLHKAVSAQIDSISANREQLELYKTLANIYSPTGAQAYVLDSVIDSFNEIIQKYIDVMSPNMTYTLNSFKETGKGDIVAKFSETLTKDGEIISVGSLSGGEEKGLSLCVDFALLEVLETQFGMSLNPIILDEPFDHLDAAGREIVIDLLESLARNRQILVIDHSSEAKSMFSKVIRVELRNNISTVL